MSDAALGALSFVVLLGLMALRMLIGLAMFVTKAILILFPGLSLALVRLLT